MSRFPKRLEGCKGCTYLNVSHAACDYNQITGKSRVAQKAPLLPGGGCRLKVEDAKCIITGQFSKKAQKRYRVVMPDGKVRFMKEDEYKQYKEDQK